MPGVADAASQLGTVMFRSVHRLTNKGRRYEWQVPTGLTAST
ncbi:hypothetical protein [Streptomyces sp. YGL11-2]